MSYDMSCEGCGKPLIHCYHKIILRKEIIFICDECFKKLDDVLELHGSEQMVYLMMAEYYERKGRRSETLVSLRKAAESGMNIMEMVVQLPILRPLQKNTEFSFDFGIMQMLTPI